MTHFCLLHRRGAEAPQQRGAGSAPGGGGGGGGREGRGCLIIRVLYQINEPVFQMCLCSLLCQIWNFSSNHYDTMLGSVAKHLVFVSYF